MVDRSHMVCAIQRQRTMHMLFALFLIGALVFGWFAFEYIRTEPAKLLVLILFIAGIIGSAVTLTISARLPHRRKKMDWLPGLFVFTLLMLLPIIGIIALIALRPNESDIETHEQWAKRLGHMTK